MSFRRSLAIVFFVAVTALAGGPHLLAQQAPTSEQVAVKFSDPSRPGTLEVHLMGGSVTVHGVNRQDVQITAHTADGAPRAPRPADTAANGLRRLTPAAGFQVEEERNVIEVSAGFNQGLAFDIQVPLKTNLRLGVINSGSIAVSDVEGEMELNNINGTVTLTNVAGSVVAHTVNGKQQASLTRVTPDKPMSFTSLNGTLDVTLPSTVKATFKLRSDQGDVFTDFDLQPTAAPKPAVQDTGRGGGRYRVDVNNGIYGTVNGGGPEIELRTFNGTIYLRKGK